MNRKFEPKRKESLDFIRLNFFLGLMKNVLVIISKINIIIYIMKVEVVVHPNARKTRIEKDLLGMLHVYVNAPPLEGKANQAVIEALTEFYKTKRNKIFLVQGTKSKNKIFEIID